jgi:putative sporulation protein YtaF
MISWSLVLLVIVANLDNLLLGAVYGLREIKILPAVNLILAVISGLAILFSGYFGFLICRLFSVRLCALIGGFVLVAIGVWVLVAHIKDQRQNQIPPQRQTNSCRKANTRTEAKNAIPEDNTEISMREAWALGLTLALNCIPLGIGAGLGTVNVPQLAFWVAFFSYVSVWAGLYLGNQHGILILKRFATPIAGVILIAIGLYQAMSYAGPFFL